ncbi:MAG: hypothetical protein OEM50_01055 [Gammaproteobacteria bacterium]|nr:hypothetical protein [Gammaproteobacteria bacterium]MDH3362242.1 hypothetical protein [Gammaproteobacteria bacterium]MDH3480273.1 hypothetical protein [Gammaproteobacteria bacterium]
MNDLDQLKELLFGAEKQALDSISERVERREIRTADVADILPEAIHQSHQKDGELVESLTQPVGECLQQALRDEPETYADALYPVMGPAIRKSIMHALRNFSQQINEAVEHSVSPTGLKWRWQASRAGIPFGEYVLQKTMRYRVEQAYLISRENGLLVDHVHHESSKIKDSDAVSAMFTAIQDFVKESFSPDRTGRLESADMGEFTLWAVHGPHALLVCVIRGVPPKSLRADLSAILERIHFRYGDAIREYKGDTSTVPDVEDELERCLRFEARDESTKKREGPPGPVLVLLLLLALAAVFFGVRSWMYSQQQEELEAALNATPGLYVTSIDRDGGHFTVRGLRDPLAMNVADVAESIDIPSDRVSVSMQPFQSLQPEILAERAARMLGKPESVDFRVSGTTLHASGQAPWAWRQQLRSRFNSLVGIDRLDVSGLQGNDRQQIADRVAGLNQRQFFFGSGVEFLDGDQARLREFATELAGLVDEAREFGYLVSVTAKGSADSVGSAAANAALADRRATVAAQILAASGINARILSQPELGFADEPPREDVSLRFVQFDLQLEPLPDSP